MSDLETKIIADLKKTGYLSELKVAQTLDANGWQVSFGETYQDLDESKSREIDIVASRVGNDESIKLQVVFNLFIEVKREESHPWVVFMNNSSSASYGWGIMHAGEAYLNDIGTIFGPTDLNNDAMLRQDGKTGTSFYEAFKKTDSPSKIYKALIGASKAAYSGMRGWGEHPENAKFQTGRYVVVEFFIPLAVVDGKLFEAHYQNGQVSVKEVGWLPIKLNHSSPRYSEHGDLRFYPYLSTTDGLVDFLRNANTWFRAVLGNFQARVAVRRNDSSKS